MRRRRSDDLRAVGDRAAHDTLDHARPEGIDHLLQLTTDPPDSSERALDVQEDAVRLAALPDVGLGDVPANNVPLHELHRRERDALVEDVARVDRPASRVDPAEIPDVERVEDPAEELPVTEDRRVEGGVGLLAGGDVRVVLHEDVALGDPGAALRFSSVHLTITSPSVEKNWIVGLITTTSPVSVRMEVA